MNIEELRSQARTALEQTLNQLQAATLLVAELETQISEAGRTVQNLTLVVEQLVEQQVTESNQRPGFSAPEETNTSD